MRPLVLILFLFLSVAVQADSITATFNLDAALNLVASQGTVKFVLNPDGTISATVSITNGTNIVGFGYDSLAVNLPESNFSPTVPDNMSGWFDSFGYHYSGFFCSTCGSTESFLIGNAGDFGSVFDVLNGNTASTDFFFKDSTGLDWGARVPEPGSMILLGTGLLGLAGVIRHRLNG